MNANIITAQQAADLIKDSDTLAVGGFLGFSIADDILCELEKKYVAEGHPNKLTITSVAGLGGDGKVRGINRFGHSGMIGKFYCANITLAENISKLVAANEFPTFMAPQGVMAQQMRAIAGGKLGVFTHVGLKTYCDPRNDGCKINKAAFDSGEEVVQLLDINGNECLFYPSFPINVAIIKGTSADMAGNISCEHEAVKVEQIDMASAARNSGGIVICQVDRIVEKNTLNARSVEVPGALIDYIVVGAPENSRQQYAIEKAYEPSWSGEIRIPLGDLERMPLNVRKVIARRAAMEIKEGDFVNLGIGVPTGVSNVLNEEGLGDHVSLSIESGTVGGVPASGLGTGASYNVEAIIKQTDNFDFYDGGGIDLCCLGGAEYDKYGNVNVSKFGGKVTGPGGFINISQNARIVCFTGTFTAGKGNIYVKDGRLVIEEDYPFIKFKDKVEHITFSGEYSIENGKQKVLFITERAIFELRKEGVVLTEIAPGVDLQKDILAKMEFAPIIAEDLKLMDERIFREENMGLELKK